jgi:Rho termination factor, N-terminal domain
MTKSRKRSKSSGSKKRSKSSKRRRSGSRSSRLKRAMRSRHFAARVECLKKKMVSFKRKGKIHCRSPKSAAHLSRHQSRYVPTEYDYLKSKTVKRLKKLAKSKGLEKYSTKTKTGLIRSILNA